MERDKGQCYSMCHHVRRVFLRLQLATDSQEFERRQLISSHCMPSSPLVKRANERLSGGSGDREREGEREDPKTRFLPLEKKGLLFHFHSPSLSLSLSAISAAHSPDCRQHQPPQPRYRHSRASQTDGANANGRCSHPDQHGTRIGR